MWVSAVAAALGDKVLVDRSVTPQHGKFYFRSIALDRYLSDQPVSYAA